MSANRTLSQDGYTLLFCEDGVYFTFSFRKKFLGNIRTDINKIRRNIDGFTLCMSNDDEFTFSLNGKLLKSMKKIDSSSLYINKGL